MFFFHFHAEQLAQRHCFGKCLASMFPFPLLLSILISVNAFGSSLGQQEDIEEGELCHPPFGCFPNTADFVHSIFRPVNLHPEAPAAVDTHFYFYAKWLSTNATDDNLCGGGGGDHLRPAFDVHYQPCVFTTADLLDKEKFDRKLKRLAIDKQQSSTPAAAAGVGQQWTAFVVHGFLDNLSENSWMTRMKDRLLRLVDNAEVAEGGRTGGRRHYESVVLVDWQGGNHIPYLQATANTRLVGAQIAFLARRLHHSLHLDIARTHIIGHSLGAHIAGYAGKRLRVGSHRLGRISALDPAGPNFDGMPRTVRLDKDDAHFVDVIHTNGKPLYLFGYGIHQALGHVDFYPNGGNDQPGCEMPALSTVFGRLVSRNTGSPSSPFAALAPSLPAFSSSSSSPLTSFLPSLDHVGRATGDLLVCSHVRAIAYFLESIPVTSTGSAASCRFNSIRAASWSDYIELRRRRRQRGAGGKVEDLCRGRDHQHHHHQDDCASMGFHAYEWYDEQQQQQTRLRTTDGHQQQQQQQHSSHKFYLETNSKPLYCKT